MAYSFRKLCSNLIPTGKYKAQITDVKFKTNSLGECSKDILVVYTIIEGEYAKKTVMDTIYEKAYDFRLMPFLTACKVDVNREFATAEEMFKFGLKEAKNKIVMIDISVKTYNGKDYNNITNIYPIAGSTVTAEDVAADFGDIPDLAGNTLVIPEEKTSVFAEPAMKADEPALDIDLNISDEDLPF